MISIFVLNYLRFVIYLTVVDDNVIYSKNNYKHLDSQCVATRFRCADIVDYYYNHYHRLNLLVFILIYVIIDNAHNTSFLT